MSDIDNTTSMRDFMPSDTNLDNAGQPELADGGQGTPSVPAEPAPQVEQTSEPTFASGFDPSKLPPELQQAYKQMQGDYTKKTQELAEARRFQEAYSQYAPMLNYIAQNPQIVEAYMGQGSTGQVQQQQPEITYSDDPVEFARQIREETKKEAMTEFMNFYNEQRQADELQARQVAEADEASTIDPRLNTDEEFADQVVGLMARDAEFIAGRKSAVEATKEAIAKVDGYLNKRLEGEKQKLSELAKAKRSPLPSGSPRPTVSQEHQPKTMREAAAEFLK